MANPARILTFEPKFVESMPRVKEHGILYVSYKYELAIHLCACGCGYEAVTPFDEKLGWTLGEDRNTDDNTSQVTLRPSIGNWKFPCKSHYYITNNKVRWL